MITNDSTYMWVPDLVLRHHCYLCRFVLGLPRMIYTPKKHRDSNQSVSYYTGIVLYLKVLANNIYYS